MATKFKSKAEAQAAAQNIPLAGAVFVSPVTAAVEGVVSGWYVGFPSNVRRALIDFSKRS